MKKQKNFKDQRGITLIALIITIIVLVILTAISTTLIFGEGSIINYAQKAVQEYKQQADEEKKIFSLDVAGEILQDYFKPTNWNNSSLKAMTDGFGGIIPLPEKCEYLEGNLKDGLVIIDSNKNEWVWIPVSNEKYNEMIVTSETEYTLQDNKTSTNVYSKIYSWTGDSQKEAYDVNEYVPGSRLTAEPESIRDSSNDVERYKKMLESLKKYNGFYVGRYELGKNEQNEAVIQKGAIPYGNTTWQDFLNICENINVNTSDATTEIIWGCQWDIICDWLSSEADSSGKTYNVVTSNWGNYVYFSENGEYVTDDVAEAEKLWGDKFGEHNTFRGMMNTGSSEKWKAKNIYDFAGNVWEWTQQGYNWHARVCRGGSSGYYNTTGAASIYNLDAAYSSGKKYGTRCSMYIN